MAESQSLTGYGPCQNLVFFYDEDERHYEQLEVNFIGYLKLRKLKATI